MDKKELLKQSVKDFNEQVLNYVELNPQQGEQTLIQTSFGYQLIHKHDLSNIANSTVDFLYYTATAKFTLWNFNQGSSFIECKIELTINDGLKTVEIYARYMNKNWEVVRIC